MAVAVLALATAGLVVSTAQADAVTGYHVVVGSAGVNARSGPGTGYGVVGTLVNGQELDIACQTKGTLVGTGLPGTPTDVWDQLTNGWFLTDYYTSTTGMAGSYTPGIPRCGAVPTPPPTPPAPVYNRMAAASWAIHNYNANPNGSPFFAENSDCTNFVSQTLWAGGLQKTNDWTDKSTDGAKLATWRWNPGGTKNEASADYFKNYVVNSGIATIKQVSWSDNTAGGAQYGDIIGYDWNGRPDGILDHLAIVTGFANSARTNPNVPSTRLSVWTATGPGIRVRRTVEAIGSRTAIRAHRFT